MKKLVSVTLFVSFLFPLVAQDSLEYAFDQARAQLAKREVKSAINYLRKVYISQPDNANINFLMGAAYTELPGTQEEAIFHLKKALQNINEAYKVGSYVEKGSPIHVYYYLAIALVEKDECAEANKAFEYFTKYDSRIDRYFIEEVERHLQKCPFNESEISTDWNKVIQPPKGYDPIYLNPEESPQLDSSTLAERGLVTQHLEYTTNAPLYGVQIASNLNPSPTSSYSKVNNVDVFIDNQGIIRYVVGHFSYRKQAESLLNKLIAEGYKDAFVVNVNNERKYSNEVISYKNINLRAGIRGVVEYYVQLGAYRDTVPDNMLKLYLEINGIKEVKEEELTLLMIGPFSQYSEALNQNEKVKLLGLKDPFIVAYNKGKKIPLDEAKSYTD